MQKLRYFHRLATIAVGIVLLFLAVTGTLIQLIDLRSIYTQAPATDANVRAMRESFDGPPDYAVRRTDDYLSAPLPPASAFPAMFDIALRSARRNLGAQPLRFIELRMIGGVPVGQVGVGAGYVRFDARDGRLLRRAPLEEREPQSPDSQRNTVKRLHRMTSFGTWALYLNVLSAVALATLIVTGILLYVRLLGQRRKIKRPALFWSAGGSWRTLHRATALACALFLSIVAISGTWLAVEGLYRSFDVTPEPAGAAPVPAADHSAPLQDERLATMLRVTLTATAARAADAPIKVVRLRSYAGYPQGIVVTGGEDQRQLVFNAETGKPMSETEPGYPKGHFPFGWQVHQWAKSVHRGDMIGLTGRWLDLVAGLAMLYLTISGGVMYWQMWRRRQRAGRSQLVWK